MKNDAPESKLSFAETLDKLEEVLQKLESSECPLEEAIELLKKG